MWLFFALISGVFYTAENLILRYLLRQQKDAWAFAFFYSAVGTVITLPFMLAMPKVPHELGLWLLVPIVGLLIVANNLLLFKSSGLLEASLVGALLKLRLVWVFILGVLILQTPFSWDRLLGTILAITAGLIIVHKFRKSGSITGVSLVVMATIFNASIVILSKYLLNSFNAVSLTFFVSFLPPMIIMLVVMPHALVRIKKLFKNDWPIVFAACACGAFANLALNAALSLHDATSVLVISETFLILVLVGEHTVLKEREHGWVKVLSVALAIAGAILIDISH